MEFVGLVKEHKGVMRLVSSADRIASRCGDAVYVSLMYMITRATVTPQNPSADRSENGPTGSDLDQGNIFTESKANPLRRALMGLIGQYH